MPAITLHVGGSSKFRLPGGGWALFESDTPAVASFDVADDELAVVGTLTGVAAGTATITITDDSGTCDPTEILVRVTAAPTPNACYPLRFPSHATDEMIEQAIRDSEADGVL